MSPLPAVGLLAPVPLEHLIDGIEVCRENAKVAFGTRAWETIRQLDREAGEGAPVLIYASHSDEHLGPVVSWAARYSGSVESIGGAHPEGDLYRPPSTQVGGEDESGWWAEFWEVTNLRRLPEGEYIPIYRVHNLSGKKFRRDFVPEGPTLISTTGDLPLRGPDN